MDQADCYLSEKKLLNLALRRKHHISHSYSYKTPCWLLPTHSSSVFCYFLDSIYQRLESSSASPQSAAVNHVSHRSDTNVCTANPIAQHRTEGPVVNYVPHIPVGYYFERVINR